MFSSEFFAGNRERLRQLFTGTAPIVVTANGLLQRGGDSTFPFQQDANFWYLTGVNEPDIVLVMDKNKEYLIVPGREANRVAFDGAVEHELLARRSGIKTVLDDETGWRQLGSRLKRVKHVATLAAPLNYIEQYGLYTNPARTRLLERIKDINDQLEMLDIGQHLVHMRSIKQAPELVAIQEAIDITAATLKEVTAPAKLAKYAWEYEVEADISRGFRRRGATGHAFAPIVASGLRACTLHNIANNGRLSADELMVLDVGAEVDQYAADLTRTVSLSSPSKRQQAVYAAVLEVQAYALSLLGPGTVIREYEEQVEHFMGEKLRELGLVKTIEHDEVRHYYPHATSHFLGLNVHDVGDYSQPLEQGMVLTVEPGIYIPEEAIGIRIEDNVLITQQGYEVLSAHLPHKLS